tara:strand:- start:254 stop:556 length:303 start_codon:yes stop_codon:yes gene_type:complete
LRISTEVASKRFFRLRLSSNSNRIRVRVRLLRGLKVLLVKARRRKAKKKAMERPSKVRVSLKRVRKENWKNRKARQTLRGRWVKPVPERGMVCRLVRVAR